MKKRNVLSAVIAFALTVNGAVSAYAQAEQASTADGGAAADSVNAEVQESEADSKQADEQIVKTAVSEENLPDSLDAEAIIADGYVARLNSEEQSLSEIVLEKEDGTRSLYLFGENVKYIDENGEVADKSNNAVRRGNAYVNEGNDVEVILPATLTAGIAVTGDELNITMKPLADKIGRSLSPAVKTADDTVVYSDVFDSSTNIEYTYTYGGVKENIVLESYNGKNSFDYEITTGGLSLYEDKGTLLLADESGDVKATLGEVIVFSADNKNNTIGKYKVEELEKNNRYKVTMIVDRAYLTDPDTKYPVKIDPDVINSTSYNMSIQDMQVFKGKDGKGTSETSAGYSGVSRVGWTDWGACRTLIKLHSWTENEERTNALIKKHITRSWQIISAYVEIRDVMCQSVSTPIVCAQFKGNNWTEKDVKTWNTLNAGSAGSPVEIYRQSDTSNKSHAYNVKSDGGDSIRTKYGYGKQWYAWNITPLVKNWLNNSSNMQKGLVFMTASTTFETASYAKNMKTFSSMQGNADYKPYFVINYNSNGCRGYTRKTSTNINCLLLATEDYSLFRKYEKYYSDSFRFFYLTDEDIESIRVNKTVSYALKKTRQRFQQWLETYHKGGWRYISSDDTGYKAVLDDDEWLICMRVGSYYNAVDDSVDYDYHFWYRANDGVWYNKHGWSNPSEQASENVNPSVDNAATGWMYGNKTFYTSDTVYYAIKKN